MFLLKTTNYIRKLLHDMSSLIRKIVANLGRKAAAAGDDARNSATRAESNSEPPPCYSAVQRSTNEAGPQPSESFQALESSLREATD